MKHGSRRDTGWGIMVFCWCVHPHSIFYFYWLYKLIIILVGCFSVLPARTLCSINRHYSSLQIGSLWLPLILTIFGAVVLTWCRWLPSLCNVGVFVISCGYRGARFYNGTFHHGLQPPLRFRRCWCPSHDHIPYHVGTWHVSWAFLQNIISCCSVFTLECPLFWDLSSFLLSMMACNMPAQIKSPLNLQGEWGYCLPTRQSGPL